MKKHDILEYLNIVSQMIPAPLYWWDINNRILGGNDQVVKAIGGGSVQNFIGKTPYEYYPYEIADRIVKHNQKVIETRQTLSQEEMIIDLQTGQTKYFIAIKSPLFDNEGNIIGVIGTSIEITAEKEAERLKHENRKLDAINKMNKIVLEKESQFREIVGQAAHDIRSPLSSLETIVKNTLEISEPKRITLRDIARNISDITNHLLNQFNPHDNPALSENNKPQTLLVSLALAEIIGDRRHKYKNLPIIFDYTPDKLSYFASIKIEPSKFRRMIVNLINNSIDAMPKKGGEIKIRFIARDKFIYITIEDNGKGIPKNVLNEIQNKNPVTYGKENGHGLGLTQVYETLKHNYGEIHIFSHVGKNHGTQINITLPRRPSPNWVAEEVNLLKDDLVIVLDDDDSIHEAWDSRFSYILEKVPTIKVKHFQKGQEVINFIRGLPEELKQRIYLLSDYELIKQGLNGLQVIENTQIKRAVLVTSHYKETEVRKLAVRQGVRILPKELANIVPIKIVQNTGKSNLINVHMVIVDDDQLFISNLVAEYYSHLVIDTYTNPLEFLNKVNQYPLDTKIILDNNYYDEHKNLIADGISIAMKLHVVGFSRLYLISGEPNVVTPDYLISIFKGDEDTLSRLDKL